MCWQYLEYCGRLLVKLPSSVADFLRLYYTARRRAKGDAMSLNALDTLLVHVTTSVSYRYCCMLYSGTSLFQASELWPPLYNSHMLFVPITYTCIN